MQALKYLEDAVQEFFIEANAIITYVNPMILSSYPRRFHG